MNSKTNWDAVQRDESQKAHAAEVAGLKQELDIAKQSLERHRNARKVRAPMVREARKRGAGDVVRVVIPDTHGALVDKGALAALLGDVKALDPHEIILLGDHVDCGGFLAQHHVMGYVAETDYTYEEDIAAANSFLDALQKAAPRAKIEYIEGNHECVTPDHEVLTRAGWKPIESVSKEDEVATLGWGGITEWQNPTAIIKKEFSGRLIESSNAFWDVAMTPGHRVCYYGQYAGDIKYELAENLVAHKNTTRTIPCSALGKWKDVEGVTDDEIRLVGWILTDGCITGGVRIYQSKPDRIEQIKALLTGMGIDYSFNFRKEREIAPINGVTIKSSLPQGFFYILQPSRERVLKLLGVDGWNSYDKFKKVTPAWVKALSQRQFLIFLGAVSDGDGHRTSDKSSSIYGSEAFLSELQGLCSVNGVRALLRQKTRKGVPSHWVLYTKHTHATKVGSDSLSERQYDGPVHCLTMPAGNFFVRRNGTVHVTGNCRVETWCITQTLRNRKDSEGLRTLLSPEFLLKLSERGIPYYRRSMFYDGLPVPGVIRRGKCYFFHGVSTSRNATAATIDKIGGNCVFGHTHRAQSSVVRRISTGIIGSWNPGCLCALQPLWQHTAPTDWSHGYAVQIVAPSGAFLHLNIPIIDGVTHFSALFKI